jgi:branched-chain amino acid transport system permease protein
MTSQIISINTSINSVSAKDSSVGMLIRQAGMVSLTQTAFFGLAGYVIGLLGAERNMPFPWRDLIAIGAVLIMALIFGLIAMRTHKIVFLMITLAFGAFLIAATKASGR